MNASVKSAKDGEQVASRALCGLASRRMRWGLTWRGRFLAALVVVAALVATLRFVHPFLAVTDRVPADVLIVEGWAPPSTMKDAADEFLSGGYKRLILMRPILADPDKYASGRYNGDYVMNLLLQDGVPKDKAVSLFPIVANKDRTFHSALDAKRWLAEQGMVVKSIDVATVGPHARRSRLMYQKAFGDDVKIGIISMPDRAYDPAHWWRSSEGVRDVLGEIIAYCYARFLFSASNENA